MSHNASRHSQARMSASIKPLPEDVIAQIKSSTSIVSLSGVVIELLKNSLDARASKVDVTVDFARGGCCIEDNGFGIAPSEFRPDGGLGRMYCTSKYQNPEACLGRNGIFLASLSALSLLTVTSHHHEHRSHNTLTLHHSKAIERNLPARPQDEIKAYSHGTRVTVRNLFGNLPVRVKQRAVIVEEKAELNRLWDGLRKEVTGLLLSWAQPVSLKIRDSENRTLVSLNSQKAVKSTSHETGVGKLRSTQFHLLLNFLTQAGYISFDDWNSFIPVSASTSSITIKGAISLKPAPTKGVQFLSLGHQPLPSYGGHNELYDEVNRIFGFSSFGAIEDDTVVDEMEKLRRERDRRYKSDGYTNRQLKGARKGTDRWPMFYLRIFLNNEPNGTAPEDDFLENEANLQSVTEVLGAMVTQWLTAHHFRPRMRRPELNLSKGFPTVESNSGKLPESRNLETRLSRSASDGGSLKTITPRRDIAGAESRKQKRATPSWVGKTSDQTRSQAFATWSRIKSSNPGFHDTIWGAGKEKESHDTSSTLPAPRGDEHPAGILSIKADLSALVDETSAPGTVPSALAPPASDILENMVYTKDHDEDDAVIWKDLSTNRTFLLNARTGCVMTHLPKRTRLAPSVQGSLNTLAEYNKSLRLAKKRSAETAEGRSSPWLDGLLQDWHNPVFKPVEKSIQQIPSAEANEDAGAQDQSAYFGCCKLDCHKECNDTSLFKLSKLSKEGLKEAQVIAQLDKKFILVKMPDAPSSSTNIAEGSQLLVLIDQHAADERIRVEALLDELCTPISKVSAYCSNLGHTSHVNCTILDKPVQFMISAHEGKLFTTQAARFAEWGILYDISTQTSTAKRTDKPESIISVRTVSPVVSERLKADPKLLSSLLRSEVYRYAESRHLPPLSAATPASSSVVRNWPQRIATCPEGLIDLVNSRACRSAIMFNDELTMDECKDLVWRLTECVFPFKCAHWRPSMVPLIDLGSACMKESSDEGFGTEGGAKYGLGSGMDEGERGKGSFIHAWRRWREALGAGDGRGGAV
ncbi:hypothetical protein GQ43DRAFT_408934 [Delitschia confertaspora ATCC 74209]|uniref:MutL C-terminal dimerisation domain-containing protein n=1 Tax=Delitschia confertaspora ATCC 74209 TaxID=1513339 RepID=A0A9P4JUQ4_9PLEO|nr:hypothetical protein GQ43DRAFT_408934 [Delitschia confertaspora ATCC 74209]